MVSSLERQHSSHKPAMLSGQKKIRGMNDYSVLLALRRKGTAY